ncbi:MAG: YbaB/EbfC family nucleoid-associated protein [Polyangiaceae bacterium]|nr:YbaB/EbfC family nucleoid-associated protein [Polyangiaceae bacterium]
MQFRGGMNELMRQASRMQRKIDERKAQLKDEEVSAATAGDKVRVVATCEGKLRSITIDPEFLKAEGMEMALDAVIAAANSALDEADKKVESELNKITGGIKIPGM